MTNKWYEFYKNRLDSRYTTHFQTKYKPFLEAIADYKPYEIVEAGCGIGSVSKYFKEKGFNCYGFDNNLKMLELTRLNVPEGHFWEADLLSDIASEQFIITHGVLEHFTDEEIESILLRFPNSIHYVPTNKYEKPSFGDERLLSTEYWKTNFNLKEEFTFNNGYDFCFKSNTNGN